VAISGHQGPSVAIGGHQWPSVAISGHQWPSVAISGTQTALKRHSNDASPRGSWITAASTLSFHRA